MFAKFLAIFCVLQMIDMSMLLAQSNSKNFFTTLSRFSEFGLFVSSSNRFDYRLPFWFTRFPLSDPIRLQRLFWPFMGLAVANVRAWWGNKRCTIYSGKLRSKLIFFNVFQLSLSLNFTLSTHLFIRRSYFCSTPISQFIISIQSKWLYWKSIINWQLPLFS